MSEEKIIDLRKELEPFRKAGKKAGMNYAQKLFKESPTSISYLRSYLTPTRIIFYQSGRDFTEFYFDSGENDKMVGVDEGYFELKKGVFLDAFEDGFDDELRSLEGSQDWNDCDKCGQKELEEFTFSVDDKYTCSDCYEEYYE